MRTAEKEGIRRVVIVDAYNVMHKVPAWRGRMERSLADGRLALVQYCAAWMAQRRDVWKFFLVFDGDSEATGSGESAGPGVQTVFTSRHETADERILLVVRECGPGFRYTVVSADGYVQAGAKRLGAATMLPATFASALRRARPAGDEVPGDADKDLPAHVRNSINAELLREWGLDSR